MWKIIPPEGPGDFLLLDDANPDLAATLLCIDVHSAKEANLAEFSRIMQDVAKNTFGEVSFSRAELDGMRETIGGQPFQQPLTLKRV